VTDFILKLLFVSLGDLVVLAIDAAKIAVAEEDVSCAFTADQRRLFTKVRRVRRDDRPTARVTCGNLVVQTIIQTVARADRAALQQTLQLSDSLFERSITQQAKI